MTFKLILVGGWQWVVIQKLQEVLQTSALDENGVEFRQEVIHEGFRNTSSILHLQILTSRTGVILRGKMTLQRDDSLTKAVCSIELVLMNMHKPLRETQCPLKLQLHTSWTGSILTGKMTLQSKECLGKVVHTMELGVLNIKPTVRKTLCPFDSKSRLREQGAS